MTLLTEDRVFPGLFNMGGICPLHMGGGQVQEDKALMGGGLMRGDLTLVASLYHKLKVLLLLICNYMMQFIG